MADVEGFSPSAQAILDLCEHSPRAKQWYWEAGALCRQWLAREEEQVLAALMETETREELMFKVGLLVDMFEEVGERSWTAQLCKMVLEN